MNRPYEPPSGNPARRAATFELADEVVLCSLDQMTWRPMATPGIIGLGLSACLIGQLLAFARVQIADDLLVMSYTAQPPTTVLTLEVWEAVKAESSPQPVKTWLQYLTEHGMGTGGIFERVVGRMASRGLVEIERQGLLGRRTAYVPTDLNAAAWPLARIRRALNREDLEAPTGRDAFLTGLLSHMGFGQSLADTNVGRRRIEAATAGLDSAVRRLLSHLEVLIGQAAMTGR